MTSLFDEITQIKNCALETLIDPEPIGVGNSRRVYSLVRDDTLVIKLEYSGRTFHNQVEWLVWQEVKDWPINDWFAPCVSIDSWGSALIQRRTQPFDSEQDFKDALRRSRGGRLPEMLADTHYHNFGMLNDQVVCHDYGYHRFLRQGAQAMCQELGYLQFDEPPHTVKTHRPIDKGQLNLDL
jgi:hypothetical protein